MKHGLPTVFVLLLSTIALAAERAPVDRSKFEPTQTEINQAALDNFKKADAELNRVYADIRKAYADDPAFLTKLRDAQQAWLKFRDAEVEALYPPHEHEPAYYGSAHPMCVAKYRAKLTADRVVALRAWLLGVEEGDVCSGSISFHADELRSRLEARVQHVSAVSLVVKQIDEFCDALAPMTKNTDSGRLLGHVQSNDDDGRWVEFERQADLEAAVEAESVFDVAHVWSRPDGARVVSMTFTSGSGDWFHLVEYCYRADGTFARTNSTLNTFNAIDDHSEKNAGGASRLRERYFDSTGKQIKVSEQGPDLRTKRAAPTLHVMNDEEPIYKTAAALPFWGLLQAPDAFPRDVEPGKAAPVKARPRHGH